MNARRGGSMASRADDPLRRRRWYVMLVALAVLLSVTVVIGRLVRTHDGPTSRGWDARVATWMADHRSAWLTSVATDVSWIGSAGVLLVATLGGGIWVWRCTHRAETAILPLLALIIAQVVVRIAKRIVARARPPASLASSTFGGWAWPSGHAASAAAVAASVCVVAATLHVSPSRRRIVYFTIGSIAAIVSASRVVLGAHWTTDVLMGDVIGVAIVIIIVRSTRLGYIATEGVPPAEVPISRERGLPTETHQTKQ